MFENHWMRLQEELGQRSSFELFADLQCEKQAELAHEFAEQDTENVAVLLVEATGQSSKKRLQDLWAGAESMHKRFIRWIDDQHDRLVDLLSEQLEQQAA